MRSLVRDPVGRLGIAIAFVVLLAVLAMTLAEVRRNTTYPADTAQGTVRSYLEAIVEDDRVKAFSFVASESPCTQQDMDAAFGEPMDRTIVQFAEINGDRATVGIRLEMGYQSVFGGKVTQDHTFSLVREGDQWKLTDRIWPMETCA